MLCLIKDSAEDSANSIRVDPNHLPEPFPTLSANQVHLWRANLDDHVAGGLRPLLAADEISRADRFHFDKDRNHYIVARGLLRKLLGSYLNTPAAELSFSYAEKGKPFLASGRYDAINFNLAHSHGLAVYAFSTERELGVDLEFIREDFGGDQIAERFFSSGEIEVLRSVSANLKNEAFFNCWTRKEAYIKARGEGLSMPLDQFEVSLAPGEAAALLRNHKEPGETARWSMQTVEMPDGYVAALVAEGHNWQLKTFVLEHFPE
jgi:4'-phosphopantetheinyl transferase